MLLEREQDVTSGRTTQDLDAIVDVRAVVGGSGTAAGRLTGAGCEPSAEHLKVHAWQARQASRDAEDLVRLLDLVQDVDEVRGALKPAERRRLAAIAPLADERSMAWRAARDPDNARAAFARLSQ